MPITTPPIKVNSVKNYGGKIILHGDNFDEAYAHANKLARKKDILLSILTMTKM